jgi:hypothetical protein
MLFLMEGCNKYYLNHAIFLPTLNSEMRIIGNQKKIDLLIFLGIRDGVCLVTKFGCSLRTSLMQL